jgi:predicted membrane-bound mannosyltransferase
MPHWRELMRVDPALYKPIFQDALVQMQTPWSIVCAVVIVTILAGMGIFGLKKRTLPWFAFSGAVLSTLLVDGLFWVAATMA